LSKLLYLNTRLIEAGVLNGVSFELFSIYSPHSHPLFLIPNIKNLRRELLFDYLLLLRYHFTMTKQEKSVALTNEPEVSNKNEPDILWQVHEISLPEARNLYEATDLLIDRFNVTNNQKGLSKEERWIFEDRRHEGAFADVLTPKLSIMLFHNADNVATGLIYDMAFSARALMNADGAIVIPLGNTRKVLHQRYYAAKLQKPEDEIPPLPSNIVSGYLKKESGNYKLDSIFINGSDAGKQYEAAKVIKGFPTEAYYQICFWHNYGDEFRNKMAERLISEHGLPDGLGMQKLLDYDPKEN